MVIKGTQDAKNIRIKKATQGLSKIRCQFCKELAVEVPDGRGGNMLKCVSCKRTFKMSSL